MLNITSRDEDFFNIVEYIKSPTPKTDNLIHDLQSFRSHISLRWVDQFYDCDQENCLGYVWLVLFSLANHDEPVVRITSYNVIGALLFSLTPYSPNLMMKSFSNAVIKLKMSSKASIAIIASFLYICNNISPTDLEDFITNTPIMHHFRADTTNFIKYMPRLINLMEKLNLQFQQVLLRSLLTSFGRNPNHDFVSSVTKLVKLNPNLLLSNLMDFVVENKLNQTILYLGPILLTNDEVFDLMDENYINEFINVSLNVLKNNKSVLTDFENACGTLSIITKKISGEKLEDLKNKINENKQEVYPNNFKRFLVLLPTPFDELLINSNDSNSLKCEKLKSITTYLSNNNNDVTKQKLLDYYESLLDSQFEVFSTFVNSVADSFNLLLGFNDTKFSFIIKTILDRKCLTWVQESAIINLLTTIGIDRGVKFIPEFESIAINIIFHDSFSPHEELSESANKCIIKFINYDNLPIVLKNLWEIDYFNERIALQYLVLLNILLDVIEPKFFKGIEQLVCEIILFHDNNYFIAGQGFRFLYRCSYINVSELLSNTCLDWIVRLIKSITQNTSKIFSPLNKEQLPYMITTLNTDVVAADINNSITKTYPLFYCYQYYSKLESNSERLMILAIEISQLFPEWIIPFVKSNNIFQKGNIHFNIFCAIVARILNYESSLDIVSYCCDFLCDAENEIQNKTVDIVRFFINKESITSAKHLYSLYKYYSIISNNEEEKQNILNTIRKRMDLFNLTLFEIKLGIIDESIFSSFVSEIDFSKWPLYDKDFLKYVNSKSEFKTIKINFDLLDNDNLKYYYFNQEKFDSSEKDKFNEFYKKNECKVYKYIDHKIKTTNYVFKNINLDLNYPSILPQLLSNQEKFESDLMLCMFFKFTNYVLDEKKFMILFDQIKTPETYYESIMYSKRIGINIPHDKLSNLTKLDNEKLNGIIFPMLGFSIDCNQYCNFNIKSKQLIELCKLISSDCFHFDINLCKFIIGLLERIREIESTKKIILIFRVLNQIIDCFSKKLPQDFIDKIIEVFLSIYSIDLPSLILELSYIFNRISGKDRQKLEKIYSYYDKLLSKFKIFIQSTPQLKKISKNTISDNLTSNIPSIRIRTLKLVYTILSDTSLWGLFVQILNSLSKSFAENSSCPIFNFIFSQISSLIISHQQFESIKKVFINTILPYIYVDPNSPQFAEYSPYISVIAHTIGYPLPQYVSYVDTILKSNPMHPNTTEYYCDYVRWVLLFEKDPIRKTDVILQGLQTIQKILIQHPTNANSDCLIDILLQNSIDFEHSFFLLGKLAMLPIPITTILIIIQKYIRRCKKEDYENCKEIFESISDSYGSSQKAELIRLILNKNAKEALVHYNLTQDNI